MHDSSTALTLGELHSVAADLQALVGAQLQDVWVFEHHLALGFYHERAVCWLWFDLDPRAPHVVWLENIPQWARKKSTKPITLFIRAHVEGQRLAEVKVPAAQGKVLLLTFARAEIEARLFAGGVNFIVRAGEKTVSFDKVRELSAHGETRAAGRSWEQITQAWLNEKSAGPQGEKRPNTTVSPAEAVETRWRRDLDKKQKALAKMRADLLAKQNPIWRQAGEWLKGEGAHDFPHEIPQRFAEVIEKRAPLSANIEAVFKKAKDSERKQDGGRERIEVLQKEILAMEANGPGAHAVATGQKKPAPSLLAKAEARGRQLHVGDGLDAYIGKSAADNLALLRRAQPFDYWLHLRDYPGTHAIMRRVRTRVVKDGEFALVGAWVAQQSFGKTAEELKGLKLDVLIVECRYVRPIKGDKLGRVHYTHDRVLTCRL